MPLCSPQVATQVPEHLLGILSWAAGFRRQVLNNNLGVRALAADVQELADNGAVVRRPLGRQLFRVILMEHEVGRPGGGPRPRLAGELPNIIVEPNCRPHGDAAVSLDAVSPLQELKLIARILVGPCNLHRVLPAELCVEGLDHLHVASRHHVVDVQLPPEPALQ